MSNFINNFKNKKLVEYLKPYQGGKILLLFQHGLGDLILFMPLVKELKKNFSRITFKIGHDLKRDFSFIGDLSFPIDGTGDFRKILRLFTYVFNVEYPEPDMNKSRVTIMKPYLCNEREIGLNNFIWEPYKLEVPLKNEDSNIIGCHFFGNTNARHKNPTDACVIRIWKEVEKAGYIPYEIHMLHHFIKDSNQQLGNNLFQKGESLRFEEPSIRKMIEKISECKYFIGVDSGPLYLAGSILGFDKVIGVQKYLEINRYLPIEISKVDIRYYKPNSIVKAIQILEGE